MKFTKEFVEDLKSKVDIVSYISRYTDLRRNGNVYVGRCPHPGHKDSTPSFRVWPDSQSWACMSCHNGSKGSGNYGSDIIAFMSWMDNLNFIDSIEELCRITGTSLPDSELSNEYKKIYDLAMKNHMNVPVIEKYLVSRGLNRDQIRKFKVGFDGSRVTFPLIDRYNNYVGFSNRAYTDLSGPKYVNSKNSEVFKKNSFLYNLNNIDKDFKEIRITEGVFDVIVPDKYEVKNLVATLGTALTDNHINIIKDLGMTPIMCFDGDEAGIRNAIKASDKFGENNIYSKILIIPEGQDLSEFALKMGTSLEEYISSNSVSYGQYQINNILNKYNSYITEYKVSILPDLIKAISSISNPLEKKVVSDKIERELDIKLFEEGPNEERKYINNLQQLSK